MQIRISYVRSVVIGLILLQSVGDCLVDTCTKYHKRASVKSVCGFVSNPLGERPDGAELTLLTSSGAAVLTVNADKSGRFAFGQVSKGDYILRATAPGYTTEERQIHLTRDQENSCKQPEIEVRLGFRSCDGGIYIKGVDKQRDLFDQRGDKEQKYR